MRHLGHKPKRTELMSLAPLFTEYHRFALWDDAARAIPVLAKGRKLAVVSADCEDGLAVPKSLGFRTVHLRRQGAGACAHASVTISSLDDLEAALRPAKVEAP